MALRGRRPCNRTETAAVPLGPWVELADPSVLPDCRQPAPNRIGHLGGLSAAVEVLGLATPETREMTLVGPSPIEHNYRSIRVEAYLHILGIAILVFPHDDDIRTRDHFHEQRLGLAGRLCHPCPLLGSVGLWIAFSLFVNSVCFSDVRSDSLFGYLSRLRVSFRLAFNTLANVEVAIRSTKPKGRLPWAWRCRPVRAGKFVPA